VEQLPSAAAPGQYADRWHATTVATLWREQQYACLWEIDTTPDPCTAAAYASQSPEEAATRSCQAFCIRSKNDVHPFADRA
jgi:hypothetical protein